MEEGLTEELGMGGQEEKSSQIPSQHSVLQAHPSAECTAGRRTQMLSFSLYPRENHN